MGLRARLRLTRQPDGMSPWVGIAILLGGAALVLLGWLWEGTWEDVFIEVGAAAGVGGIVLLFKPRLLRQVDERATDVATKAAATTAQDIASTRTEAMEKRLIKLESISDIQSRERDRFEQETERIIATVGDDASFASVNGLLDHASKLRLFAETFLVKLSDEQGQPLFETSQRTYQTETIQAVSFGIVALTHSDFDTDHYSLLNHRVHWSSDADLEEFITKVYSGLTRANVPQDKFSLETLISNLQESHRLMMDARRAPQGSGKRLNGKLMLLINDEWVVTDAGLEATESDHLYRWYENPPHDNYIDLYNALCPPDYQQALWEEAKYYAERLRQEVEREPF